MTRTRFSYFESRGRWQRNVCKSFFFYEWEILFLSPSSRSLVCPQIERKRRRRRRKKTQQSKKESGAMAICLLSQSELMQSSSSLSTIIIRLGATSKAFAFSPFSPFLCLFSSGTVHPCRKNRVGGHLLLQQQPKRLFLLDSFWTKKKRWTNPE